MSEVRFFRHTKHDNWLVGLISEKGRRNGVGSGNRVQIHILAIN
jgi:hypothetical protein